MVRRVRIPFVAALAGVLMLLSIPPASAHEDRDVGRYTFDVGWGDEPAYTGFKNSVVLFLSIGEDRVRSIGDDLDVEVTFGDETQRYTFEPNFEVGEFGDVGDYRAWLVPTRPGTYTFHITGSIKGDEIDETFTCGPRTFDCMTDVKEVEFPEQDPSGAELSERIDREIPRVTADVASVSDDVDTARLLGIIGILVGALALLVAALRKGGSKAGG
jgi:hypothetical protein